MTGRCPFERIRYIRLRLRLMEEIARVIESRGYRQREAAELFGTTQPRISELVRGRVDEFTIDALVRMFEAAGVPTPPHALRRDWVVMEPSPDPVIEAYKRDVDRTLLRETLRRTPEERLAGLSQMQRLAAEGRRSRDGEP